MCIYQPLNPENREVRLLEFSKPTSTGRNVGSRLAFKLRHESLADTSIRYATLSYVWGSGTSQERVKVEVNGAPFFITRNLYAGLEGLLRSTGRVAASSLLWIDAICTQSIAVQT